MDHKNLSQADVAMMVGVDRTTVRAWTKQGMPFIPPTARGKEASYSITVALYWQFWTKWKVRHQWPERGALYALAFAYANSCVYIELTGRDERRLECRKRFPSVVTSYFTKLDADAAISYALGYLDAQHVGNRK